VRKGAPVDEEATAVRAGFAAAVTAAAVDDSARGDEDGDLGALPSGKLYSQWSF